MLSCYLRHWCSGRKLELHSCQNYALALAHACLIPAHDRFFSPLCYLFVSHVFMSANNDDYSVICACIYTVHKRNKMLTIWLCCKIHCKLICAFLHLPQYVEGHDVEKLQLHSIANHTINSSAGKAPPWSFCGYYTAKDVGSNPASDKTFFFSSYLFGAYFFPTTL